MILETTRQIIQKHKLEEKLDFNPFKLNGQCGNSDAILKKREWFDKSRSLENSLFAKMGSSRRENWYGFDLCGCPENWFAAIDEFLAELEKDSPDFEIHQIKLKYGMARIHLGNLSAETWKAINELENVMYDENLIY